MSSSRQQSAVELLHTYVKNHFPESIYHKLPSSVWNIIANYWFPAKRWNCPVSGQVLEDPVIIIHPGIAPHVYNRDSVINASRKGELKTFGLTENNIGIHIVDVSVPSTTLISAWLAQESRSPYSESKEDESKEIGIEENTEMKRSGIIEEEKKESFISNISHLNVVAEINHALRQDRKSVLEILNDDIPFSSNIHSVSFSRGFPCRRFRKHMHLLLFGLAAAVNFIRISYDEPVLFSSSLDIAIRMAIIGDVARNVALDYTSYSYLMNRTLDYLSCINRRAMPWLIRQGILITALVVNVLLPILNNKEFLFGGSEQGATLFINILLTKPLQLPRIMMAVDVLVRQYIEKTLNSDSRSPLLSKGFGGMLLGKKIFDMYYLGSRNFSNNIKGHLTYAIAHPLVDFIYQSLAVQECANALVSLRECKRNPTRLLRDSTGKAEAIPKVVIRNIGRIIAAISAGFLAYYYIQNPLIAIFMALEAYGVSYLDGVARSANNPYRLQAAPRPRGPLLESIGPNERVALLV